MGGTLTLINIPPFFYRYEMIVRNKKAIEREKKLLNDLLVRTGYTKPKTKFRYEFPDLSVRKTASTTNKG